MFSNRFRSKKPADRGPNCCHSYTKSLRILLRLSSGNDCYCGIACIIFVEEEFVTCSKHKTKNQQTNSIIRCLFIASILFFLNVRLVILLDKIVVSPVRKSDRVPSNAGHPLDPPLRLGLGFVFALNSFVFRQLECHVSSTLPDIYKNKNYKFSVIKDRELQSSKLVLERKANLLRYKGRGKRPNKTQSLRKTEKEILLEKKSFVPKHQNHDKLMWRVYN